MSVQKHGRELRPLLGAGLAFVAMSFFSIQDAMVKWLASDYILFQLLFVRSLVAVPLLLFILRFRYGSRALHTNRPQDHAIRATINFGGVFELLLRHNSYAAGGCYGHRFVGTVIYDSSVRPAPRRAR